ncbi:MAG: hypothetical protein AB1750_06090, partial [Chloroflexota bacterium]
WYDGLYPLVAFLLIWGLAVTVEFSIYREFYVPAAVFVAAWMGAGASAALEGLSRLVEGRPARGAALSLSKGSPMRRAVMGALAVALIVAPIWNARANLQLAIQKGYTEFVQREHIYPIFAPDKAIKDATKLLNKLPPNAILFADWDKLYSYVYTAEIVLGRKDITLHEYLFMPDGALPATTLAYIEANIDARPIYFTTWVEQLNGLYQVDEAGESLYRIRAR